MPITAVDNTIEVGSFVGGWVATAEESGIPLDAFADVTNLLIDPSNGSVVTRPGFSRAFTAAAEKGWRIYSLHPYTTKTGTLYLIAVLSNNGSGSNNVRVMAHVVGTNTWSQISPTQIWNSPNARHWGATIDGTYYGGGPTDPMYSWHPTDGWKGDPGTANFKDWGSADRPGDYSWQNGDITEYTYNPGTGSVTELFQFDYDDDKQGSDGLRWPKWENDENTYKKGDKVSRKISGVWKTFRCLKQHEPTNANRPGDGTGTWRSEWEKIKAPPPLNEDFTLNRKYWTKMANAPKTNIALWHGQRLFARNDNGIGGKSTLVYSRAMKVGQKSFGAGKDKEIGVAGNPAWEPDDWRTGGPTGAGFQPFESKENDDIMTLVSLGYYLLVLKRFSAHVIAGLNPETWTVREIAPYGALDRGSACVHEGLAYFISDRGFFYSDGTQCEPVAGSEKINEWLRRAVTWDGGSDITMFSYNGYVWISLPTNKSKAPNQTIVYEPITQSFWKLNLGLQASTVQQNDGKDALFFGGVNALGTESTDTFDWGSWDGTTFTVDNSGEKFERSTRQARRSGSVNLINAYKNPNFEHKTGVAAADGKKDSDKDKEDTYSGPWLRTTAGKVGLSVTSNAAFKGGTGLRVANRRKAGATVGPYDGWEGVYQNVNSPGSGNLANVFRVRRTNWRADPDKKPRVKGIHNTSIKPFDFTYHGNGWWWVSDALLTVVTTVQKVGLVVAPDESVELDTAGFIDAPTPAWFDGDGGEAVNYWTTGGNLPLIYKLGGITDDNGFATSEDLPIQWAARSAWFTFGAGIREERQIRKIWALTRATGQTIHVRSFINFRGVAEEDRFTEVNADVPDPVTYAEGQIPPDGFAFQLEVDGDEAPASVLAFGVDTVPRRVRFGS
jgi:hypothetical protein